MNNQQTLAALAALSQLLGAAQAPAPAPAQQEDDLDAGGDTTVSGGHVTLKVRHELTVVTNKVNKKTGKPFVFNGSKYTVKVSDWLSVPRRQDLLPAKDLVPHVGDSGKTYWKTKTIWEVEVGVSSTGRTWMISAKDTGIKYEAKKDDLDEAEDLDSAAASEAKPKAEPTKPDTNSQPEEAVPAFEEPL